MTTIATLLLGDRASAQEHLLTWFGPTGLDLSQVSVDGLAVPPPEITNAVLELFDLPLSALAAQAWGEFGRVQAARRATAQNPGSRQVIRLLEHTVTSTQSPTVEATAGSVSVTVLTLDLVVELTVSGVDLVVERGAIVRFTAGSAVAGATLSVAGTTIAERRFEPVDLLPTAAEQTARPGPARPGRPSPVR